MYFSNELGNHYFFSFLLVLFTWVYNLLKFQRNLNLWNEKVVFNTILSDRFFLFFTIAQNIRLSICVQNFRTPYRGSFENNDIFFKKNCAVNAFSSLQDHWNDVRMQTSVCWRNFPAWKKYTRSNPHSNFENCQFLLF